MAFTLPRYQEPDFSALALPQTPSLSRLPETVPPLSSTMPPPSSPSISRWEAGGS